MGQKVHPIGFRLGVNVGNRHVKEWMGKWYADKDYTKFLHEDLRVRQLIMGRLAEAGVSRVDIERSANQMTVTIHAAKPGIVIGKSGVKVEELRRNLEAMTGKRVRVTIQEIRQPELDAYLVARSVADQLERRVAFRRAMKQAVGRAMRFGAKGVRIQVAGRLGGAEMSRREWEREGRVPLHTLRADIDFGQAEARTTYGVIGVKVWIYRGDVAPTARVGQGDGMAAAAAAPAGRGGRPGPGGPGGGPRAATPAAPAAAAPAAPAPAAPVAPAASAAPAPAAPAPEAPAPEAQAPEAPAASIESSEES
ncbi:MAG TPA: 30S ribosomal protein S3 [Chloroflexota bacterium]|nr:30S ribosomal protein S3 [Chloroflexota bacterium]